MYAAVLYTHTDRQKKLEDGQKDKRTKSQKDTQTNRLRQIATQTDIEKDTDRQKKDT